MAAVLGTTLLGAAGIAGVAMAGEEPPMPTPLTAPASSSAGGAGGNHVPEPWHRSDPEAGPNLPDTWRPSTPAGTGQAVDGTDLDACFDNACEVEVTGGDTIQLDGTAGVDELSIDSVADNTLTLTGSSGNGAQQSTASQTAPGRSTINDLVVDLISVDGDRAIIRLSLFGSLPGSTTE
ncbi:hypothetical protein [Streptomyces sp. NBC_01092]|uniref:hypothetical protein n=1 Tax=Streptomyces sp. NBC_01092 TaxID=2903748 RepID=UPI00386941E7|nr:hypothetical protein OG254_43815 [Streptomyces sp. NBC_01092]